MNTQDKSGIAAGGSLKLFRGLLKKKSLTPEEESFFFGKFRDGDTDARNKIVVSNARFVIKYAHKFSSPRIPFDDLIQEGCLGLLDAAEKFNPAWNVCFITFAAQFVIGRMKNLAKEVYGSRAGYVSLFDKKGADADSAVIDSLPAPAPVLPDSDSLPKESADKLMMEIEKNITRTEYLILLEYYGIGKGTARTLKDLSGELDLSQTRIHQIKKKVIRRIRKKMMKKGGGIN